MTDKEFNLINKLITSLGYNIDEIEDIFDYEEFCEHIIQEQKDLREALKEEVIYKRTYLKNLLDCKEECEALKSESFTREELISMQEKDIERYHKALEEIEKVINNIFDRCLGHKTDGCTPVHNVCEELIKILNIINKLEGEE